MNINFYKILSILLVSALISLTYNHFNPNGLNIIRNERILNWETDTLPDPNNLSLIDNDSSSVIKNPISDSLINKRIIEKEIQSDKFKEPKAIKLEFALKLFNQGERFIDARSAEEFTEGHIKDAINIPFYGSENYLDIINSLNKNEIIVTYCSSAECDIATLSGDELFKMGFKKVYVFIGGYDEWYKNNYPTSIKK